MITVTFFLKRGKLDYGRQKTITALSHNDCYDRFKKDFGEVENQVTQVEIVYHDGQTTICDLSHFKKNYCII